MAADPLTFDTALLVDDQDRRRYHSNVGLLTPYRPWFTGRTALDFGCSWGTSAIILRQLGAPEVAGVEPDLARVQRGHRLLRDIGMPGIRMHHVPDTRRLPFPDAAFDFILANAVFEHIPQPRAVHLREVWRVLAPDGHLLINETPNWYFPKDVHTTKLWFNNWLPPRVA